MAGKRMTADQRRIQLVEVARRCFAESGFSQTTTAMIADLANVTEPVLYRHFASKMELFHAILVETLEDSIGHFDTVASRGKNGAEKLLAVVEDLPRYARDNAGIFRVIDRALATANDPKTREYLGEYYRGFDGAIRAIIEEGIEDGSIASSVSPGTLSWMLVMSGIGYSLVTSADVAGLVDHEFAANLADLVENLIDRD